MIRDLKMQIQNKKALIIFVSKEIYMWTFHQLWLHASSGMVTSYWNGHICSNLPVV